MKKKMLFIALLLNLVLSLTLHAESYDKSIVVGPNANSRLTSDSKYVLKISTKSDSRWAMVRISKDGKDEDVLIKVNNAEISLNLYLRNGEGLYSIKVYESKLVEQFGGSYTYLKELTLINKDKRNMSFLLPSNAVQSDNPEIIELAKTITTDSRSEMEALKKIHKYVATSIEYDWESYRDGTYVNKPVDAVSTLKRLKNVCAGYSNLYAALLRSIGIRTKVVEGLAYLGDGATGQHAWNEVFINNEWKSVDVTWDSTTKEIYKYFLMPEELFAKDHQKERTMVQY